MILEYHQTLYVLSEIDNKQSSSQSSKNVDTYAAKSDGDRKGWVQMLKKVMFGHLGGGTGDFMVLQHFKVILSTP